MNCRHCGFQLTNQFLSLGYAPPSNEYRGIDCLDAPETYFPLKIFVCDNCWLVQTEDYKQADELFRHDYAYFSSTSKTWLNHASNYSKMICNRLGLNKNSLVIEIASNDGYLLRNFVDAGIPCLGIEPAVSTAMAAEKLGIPVIKQFFGRYLAEKLVKEGKGADLLIGNNVFAHVPDINDFTAGLKVLLKPGGTITLEFPMLKNMIEFCLFDTAYHEHYSYLSLNTAKRIFSYSGLKVWDVEELQTHGGSVRVYGCHADDPRTECESVSILLNKEISCGLQQIATYQSFQQRAEKIKDELVVFLIEQKRAGKKVAAYGAAAKGNTILNFAGIKQDLLPYVCDAAPSKQGKFLPGSHIPILHPDKIRELHPDVILILPWNIAEEVMQQYAYVREWGCVFAVAIPEMKLFK